MDMRERESGGREGRKKKMKGGEGGKREEGQNNYLMAWRKGSVCYLKTTEREIVIYKEQNNEWHTKYTYYIIYI